MRFDNLLHRLIGWCEEKTDEYIRKYDQQKGTVGFRPYLVTGELRFKLASLLEQDFADYDAFAAAVLDLMDVHYDYALKNLPNRTQELMVERTKQSFLAFFESLAPDFQGEPPKHYWRVIMGKEAGIIAERYRLQWEFERNSYWYPWSNCGRGEKLFLMQEHVERRKKELEQLLGLPEKKMYCFGESSYPVLFVEETNELEFYSGMECAYADKDFTWMIYCSHEQTVTFVGSIVPTIKKLFAPEKELWNQFEWGMT